MFNENKLIKEKIKNCFLFSVNYLIIFILILLIIFLINPDYHYLISKIKIRFSVPGDDVFFSWNLQKNTLLRRFYLFYGHIKDNFGLFAALIIFIFQFFIIFKKRDLILVYFSTVVLLFIILSKYTISHNFVSMQFIFVSYLVLVNFFKNIQKKYCLVFLILLIGNFIFINHNKSLYSIDSKLQEGYLTYLNVKNQISEENLLLKYNQDLYLRVYLIYYKLELKDFFYFKNN